MEDLRRRHEIYRTTGELFTAPVTHAEAMRQALRDPEITTPYRQNRGDRTGKAAELEIERARLTPPIGEGGSDAGFYAQLARSINRPIH
jgi:hypothetical protein